jgi:hypothetical protein
MFVPMLYESDINNLMSQWEERLCFLGISQSYKDGIRDCMYDLKTLMDKNLEEEALANEAFEQQLKEDAEFYRELEEMVKNKGVYA